MGDSPGAWWDFRSLKPGGGPETASWYSTACGKLGSVTNSSGLLPWRESLSSCTSGQELHLAAFRHCPIQSQTWNFTLSYHDAISFLHQVCGVMTVCLLLKRKFCQFYHAAMGASPGHAWKADFQAPEVLFEAHLAFLQIAGCHAAFAAAACTISKAIPFGNRRN